MKKKLWNRLGMVDKLCHESGLWAGRNGTPDFERSAGWTNYLDMCLLVDPGSAKVSPKFKEKQNLLGKKKEKILQEQGHEY